MHPFYQTALFKFISLTVIALSLSAIVMLYGYKNTSKLPIIAIANYGPHSSLEDTIKGLKEELRIQGYVEDHTVQFKIADVGFDASLIPQMVTQLKSQHPVVMVVLTTPVAQFAKNAVKNIPLVFSAITDPVEAGLLQEAHLPNSNMTGASDRQDLGALLDFAKKTLPNATRVGMLYATSEANDIALVKMMRHAAQQRKMQVVAVPIEQARDVPFRIQTLKDKVDFIYVGASGPIQPTLPAIAAEANKMQIPVFNVNEIAVQEHLVFASFGVDYIQVGKNTGKLVASLLKGEKVEQLTPLYPSVKDHHGFMSKLRAADLNISLPPSESGVSYVDPQ